VKPKIGASRLLKWQTNREVGEAGRIEETQMTSLSRLKLASLE
jgi:hypothetical protein